MIGLSDVNEEGIICLIEAIVKQGVADYLKARRQLAVCKTRKCNVCRKKAGDSCKEVIREMEEFVDSDLFSIAFPNVDGKWFLQTAIDNYEERSA